MTLEVCLPETLRGPATTITPLGGGLSGAGVYRVEAGGRGYVLKVARADAPVATDAPSPADAPVTGDGGTSVGTALYYASVYGGGAPAARWRRARSR